MPFVRYYERNAVMEKENFALVFAKNVIRNTRNKDENIFRDRFYSELIRSRVFFMLKLPDSNFIYRVVINV